jgi:hypothetical protein
MEIVAKRMQVVCNFAKKISLVDEKIVNGLKDE